MNLEIQEKPQMLLLNQTLKDLMELVAETQIAKAGVGMPMEIALLTGK